VSISTRYLQWKCPQLALKNNNYKTISSNMPTCHESRRLDENLR